jgi:hypothetical protein
MPCMYGATSASNLLHIHVDMIHCCARDIPAVAGHVCAAGCRRQIAKWRRARSFVCLLVEEAAAADGSGQPGRLLGTATLSLMQVSPG